MQKPSPDIMLHHILEQYLNVFFREMSVDLKTHAIPIDQHPEPFVQKPSLTIGYKFPACNTQLFANITHFSSIGYHQYNDLWLQSDNAQQATEIKDENSLIKVICHHLAHLQDDINEGLEASQKMFSLIQNSISNMRFFQEKKSKNINNNITCPFIESEQGMLLGHPFHATSKACIEFTDQDKAAYSPEMKASFKLHYFVATPELMKSSNEVPIYDDLAYTQARKRLPENFQGLPLLPCHPWQADMLLNLPIVRELINDKKLFSLGQIGETVWPTSSVRTVWLPQSKFFIKLSLNVRITNFIRNNTPEQLQRAIDASQLIETLGIDDCPEKLIFMLEKKSQTLRIKELESEFSILYRQGPNDCNMKDCFVISTLVEPCAKTRLPPVKKIIEAAAAIQHMNFDKGFIGDWWANYTQTVLISALTLYANTGISLEAHLQNSLLQIKEGMPYKLIVRDMEGASIHHNSPLKKKITGFEQSAVWYDENTTWHRFNYYVVVNHFAHVLASIARSCPVTEDFLWQITRNELMNTRTNLPTQTCIEKLFLTPTLPAKANLLSTFDQCGETPHWVDIPNPLYFQQLEKSHLRVINQLIEALSYEKALSYSLDKNIARWPINKDVYYQGTATLSMSFERLRVSSETLSRVCENKTTPATLSQFLSDIQPLINTPHEQWICFSHELKNTWIKNAQSLTKADIKPLISDEYLWQEARITNGHLYHPTFKSRIGFSLDDNQNYGPELAAPFQLVWVAVAQSLIIESISPQTDKTMLYPKSLVRSNNLSNEFTVIPVHPWQWKNHIQPAFKKHIDSGNIMKLSAQPDLYLPQQSIRTLSHFSSPQQYNVKLSMNFTNTSTQRTLADHTVRNTPIISDWVQQIVDDGTYTKRNPKPIILKEVAGFSVITPENNTEQAGSLACIFRESIDAFLSIEQQATPITALTQLDSDHKPIIAPWIKKQGTEVFLKALIQSAYIPVLHLLWAGGIAHESHAQNMVLIHESGVPVRVALKDFHDGIRFMPGYIHHHTAIPQLHETPATHASTNPNSYLNARNKDDLRDFVLDALLFVNLAELAWFLHAHFDYKETQFWQLCHSEIRAYQRNHPELDENFKHVDIFVPTLNIEQLASRRFLKDTKVRMQPVRNPLFHAATL